MVIGNSINESTTGICGFSGTAFTATAVTNHAILVGGSTSSTVSNIGPSATSGQVLQSGGASADPAYSTATYPSTATGTGKILRADGTNWAASTATYPDTAGTSGFVLTSDGTNFNSSSPKVLQTVFSNLIAGSTTTSASYVDVTSASLAITPTSSSNKILVIFSWLGTSGIGAGANVELINQIVRGATPITGTDTIITRASNATGNVGNDSFITMAIVDSPATTSSTTYKLQQKVNTAVSSGSTNVTITLMEIVA